MSIAKPLHRPRKARACRMWAAWPALTIGMIAGMILAGVSGGTPAIAADGSAVRACGDQSGVTVVVDFTDLGGEVETGCAGSGSENGRAALAAAGFTPTDSQPGFLCAINSMPDPCPTTFDGSFWSYWHSTPSGEWTSYQVGADQSTPAPGELEGWRYNDGTIGPGIEPAAVVAAGQMASSAEPSQATAPAPVASSPSVAAQSSTLLIITAGFAAIVVAIAIWFLVRARRRPGQPAENEDG